MIPDTSGQDVPRTPASQSRPRRHWMPIAGAAALALLLVFGIAGWLSGSRSVDASRLRIAAVTRGTLVRDASANGRVVAAVSPTLYAPAAATVALQIHAGDAVKKGDLLAVLDSPDLSNQLQREQSTLEQLQAE